MDKGDRPAKTGRKHFNVKDYGLICDWLEIEGNLECVIGSKEKTRTKGRYRYRKQAFEAMAAFINERKSEASILAKVDGKGARNRFLLLYRKYKNVKPEVDSPRWKLIQTDVANGIYTIKDKLDKLCPCFDRLNVIFGGSQDRVGPEKSQSLTGALSARMEGSNHSKTESNEIEERTEELHLDTTEADSFTRAEAQSLTEAFVAGMEAIVQAKVKSNEIRLSALELRSAMLEQKAKLAKIQSDMEIKKIIIQIISCNTHRPTHEIAELVRMVLA